MGNSLGGAGMGRGGGITMMGRTGGAGQDPDSNYFLYKQQIADALMRGAIQPPAAPERSWTQGAARLASALAGAYKSHQLEQQMQDYQGSRSQDMQTLAQALNGGNMAQAIGQMHNPSIQNQALQIMMMQQNAQNLANMQSNLTKQKGQNALDVQKLKGSAPLSLPENVLKQNIMDVSNYIAAVQNKMQQETDPAKRAALSNALNAAQQNQNILRDQARTQKGDVPDVVGENRNQYINTLNAGGVPLPGQQAAYAHGQMPQGPERAISQELGKAAADAITARAKTMDAQAASYQEASRLGDRILQDFSNNPNVTSGPGTDTQTKVVSFFNKLMPGLISNNNDQQAFQKDVGGFILAGGQRLHEIGVQRLTQMELQYIVPMFEPTLMNTKEGLKTIVEATQAANPIIQQGAQKMQQLYNMYLKNPNFDIGSAQLGLENAISNELSNSNMTLINKKLAPQGQQMIVNPDYDPVKNPTNKYIRVQVGQDGKPTGVMPGQIGAADIGADPKMLTQALGEGNPGDQYKPIEGSDQSTGGVLPAEGPMPAQPQAAVPPLNQQQVNNAAGQQSGPMMPPPQQGGDNSAMNPYATQQTAPISSAGQTKDTGPQMAPVQNPIQLAPSQASYPVPPQDETQDQPQDVSQNPPPPQGIDPATLAMFLMKRQADPSNYDSSSYNMA